MLRSFLFLSISVIFSYHVTYSQTTVFQNWTSLEESISQKLKVSWTTCKCSSSGPEEIRLFVFNNNNESKNINFDLEIYQDGRMPKLISIKNLQLSANQMVQADCGINNFPKLIVPVPGTFDPKTLRVKIKYK